MVFTLSGVWRVVANRPISSTVPVTPAAVMKSPTLNGCRTTKNTPPAKFDSSPDHAMPMATPAAAINAAKLVVSTPKNPSIAMTSTIFSSAASAEWM